MLRITSKLIRFRRQRRAGRRADSSETRGPGKALFDRDLRYVIGTVEHPRRSLVQTQKHRRSHIAVGVAMTALVATSAGFAWHNKPHVDLDSVATTGKAASEAVDATTLEQPAAARAGNTSAASLLTRSEPTSAVTAKHIGVHPEPVDATQPDTSSTTHLEHPDGTPGPVANVTTNASSNLVETVEFVTAANTSSAQTLPVGIGGAGLYAPEADFPGSDAIVNAALTSADTGPSETVETISSEIIGADVASAEAAWHRVVIKRGDTLSTIFQRAGFRATDAIRLVKNKQARLLKSLSPRSVLSLQATDEGAFGRLQYELSPERLLDIKTEGDSFVVDEINREFDIRLREVTGTIANSLFVSASDIGLNQNVIMQMAEIFEYQIDFNLDIRRGDRYSIIFEEKWDGDRKVGTGEVVAAEFMNDGKNYRAIRHVDEDDVTRYYTPEGRSLRRAFLRSPVAFSRISSGFSKSRFHPILKRWRAHKGVDYAARRGTPVRATADGMVVERGVKGGYGRTVVIRHGQRYQTLYAHMSRYRKDVRRGSKVSQGQIIGYVGRSGWATGDHLHYEFRVDNKHTNPLTVKLPRALAIDDRYLHEFLDDASLWSARLDVLNDNVAARDDDSPSNPES